MENSSQTRRSQGHARHAQDNCQKNNYNSVVEDRRSAAVEEKCYSLGYAHSNSMIEHNQTHEYSHKHGYSDSHSHSHSHGHTHNGALRISAAQVRRIRLVLTAIMVPLFVMITVIVGFTWPTKTSLVGSMAQYSSDAKVQYAEVTQVQESTQVGQPLQVRARLTTGEGQGTEVPLQVSHIKRADTISPGDQIKVMFVAGALETGRPYFYLDKVRGNSLWILLGIYVLVVALVAGFKGLGALVGLGASLVVVVFYMIPALISESNSLLISVAGCAFMLIFSVYLAHGVSIRTTTALLGTFAGLVFTVLLAWWSINFAHLTGLQGEEGVELSARASFLDLKLILLAGIVVAGLGTLNDVAITQASAVWELHEANPYMGGTGIFKRAMRIGRDHIASTIYTLAFAYVGSSLPMLMLAALVDRTLFDTLTVEEIAEELVRTFVSSSGLLLTIPFTTLLAVFLARSTVKTGAIDA